MTHGVEQTMAVPELGIFAPMDRFTASGKGRKLGCWKSWDWKKIDWPANTVH
jgi:hypothetical protein